MSLRSLTLLAVLIAAEILWSQVPPLRGVWPHLALVWFVFAAVWIPAGPLLGLAAAVGVLEDVVFGSAFGVHPLGLVVVAAAARRWRHHLQPEQRLNVAVFVFLYAAAETILLGGVMGGPAGMWLGFSPGGALMAALAAALAPRRLDRMFDRPINAAALRIT